MAGELADARFAVITALPSELHAVRMTLGPTAARIARLSGRVYDVAVVRSLTELPHTVAIVRAPQMGNPSAQLCVQQIHEDCPRIQHVIFCGIAGAAPNPSKAQEHVRLGDIVVGTEGIIPYKDGKERDEVFEIRAKPLAPTYGDLLVAAAKRLQQDESSAQHRPWDQYVDKLIGDIPQSGRPDEPDLLRENGGPKFLPRWLRFERTLAHPYDELRDTLGTKPRVFYGTVGSANIVQANSRTRDLVRERFGVRCFEMEGYGFHFSAQALRLNALVVRGTCDYCNARKNSRAEPQWQRYAANIAAAYTRALIEEVPNVPPKELSDTLKLIHRISNALPAGQFLPDELEIIDQIRPILEAAPRRLSLPVPTAGTTLQEVGTLIDPEVVWLRISTKLERMEYLQKTFAFDEAFNLAEEIEAEIKPYVHLLSRRSVRTTCYKLAQIAVVHAQMKAVGGALPDYSHAKSLLDMALHGR